MQLKTNRVIHPKVNQLVFFAFDRGISQFILCLCDFTTALASYKTSLFMVLDYTLKFAAVCWTTLRSFLVPDFEQMIDIPERDIRLRLL